ncbi:MAG: hypothetical protein R3E66_22070 [bacterium]
MKGKPLRRVTRRNKTQLSFVGAIAAHEKLDAQRYRLDDIAKAVAKRRNLELAPLERKPASTFSSRWTSR